MPLQGVIMNDKRQQSASNVDGHDVSRPQGDFLTDDQINARHFRRISFSSTREGVAPLVSTTENISASSEIVSVAGYGVINAAVGWEISPGDRMLPRNGMKGSCQRRGRFLVWSPSNEGVPSS